MPQSKNATKINIQDPVGSPGFFVQSGAIQAEYLPELRGRRNLEVFDKMRRSDGMAKAIQKAHVLPLLNATWYIESADEADPEAVLLAKKIENNLINDLEWRKIISEVLLSLIFGFYLFEFEWEIIENPGEEELNVKLKNLHSRHPKTIYKWIHDENGRLIEVEQRAYFNSGESAMLRTVRIPIDNCILFINEPEGNNYEGTSILRAMYKHWSIKGTVENIENIGAEKMALGFLTVTAPENYETSMDEDQMKKIDETAKKIVDNYRCHHNAGAYVPYGLSVNVVEGKMNSEALDKIVNRHDKKMAQSSLASFLLLDGTGGAYALSKDQTDFFLMALNGIALDICDVFNRRLVKKITDLNANVTKYPRLKVKNIAIQTDESNKETKEEKKNQDEIIKENITTPKKADNPKDQNQNFSEWRRNKHSCQSKVNFAEIKNTMDTAEEKLFKSLGEINKKQLQSVQQQIKSGASMDKINIPDMDKVENLWLETLMKIEKDSYKEIENEMNSKVNISDEDLTKSVKIKARLLSEKYKADMLVDISNFYKQQEVK